MLHAFLFILHFNVQQTKIWSKFIFYNLLIVYSIYQNTCSPFLSVHDSFQNIQWVYNEPVFRSFNIHLQNTVLARGCQLSLLRPESSFGLPILKFQLTNFN